MDVWAIKRENRMSRCHDSSSLNLEKQELARSWHVLNSLSMHYTCLLLPLFKNDSFTNVEKSRRLVRLAYISFDEDLRFVRPHRSSPRAAWHPAATHLYYV